MAIMPNGLPGGAAYSFTSGVERRPLMGEVDDLNRITLAATCEVLPTCRSRGVTLVVGLAARSIEIRADSRRLERAVACLLDDATALATTTGAGARVRVQTGVVGERAELTLITAGLMGGVVALPSLPTAQWIVEAHGGSLRIVEEQDRTTYEASLPILEPSQGNVEDRVAYLSRQDHKALMAVKPPGPPVLRRESYFDLASREPTKS